MRHQHDVGTQIGGAPAQQAMLDDFADVAGQQGRAMGGFDPQHAT